MGQSRYDRLVRRGEDERLSKALAAGYREALACGANELAQWIRLEQLGYTASNPAMTNDVVVPEYRTVGGMWFDGFGRPFVINQPGFGFVNETRVRSGVAELESLAGKTGSIGIQDDGTAALIKEHFHVEVTLFRFNPHSVEQVLANIRAQYLDRLAANRDRLAADAPGRDAGPFATPQTSSGGLPRRTWMETAAAAGSAGLGSAVVSFLVGSGLQLSGLQVPDLGYALTFLGVAFALYRLVDVLLRHRRQA